MPEIDYKKLLLKLGPGPIIGVIVFFIFILFVGVVVAGASSVLKIIPNINSVINNDDGGDTEGGYGSFDTLNYEADLPNWYNQTVRNYRHSNVNGPGKSDRIDARDVASFINPFGDPVACTHGSGLFGEPRSTHSHGGIDSRPTKGGVPYLYSIAAGTVVSESNSINGEKSCYPIGCCSGHGANGNALKILHKVNGRTYLSVYLHLKTKFVSIGDTVTQGQKIGIMGDTGCSLGAHIHFEIQYPYSHANNDFDKKYDPIDLFYKCDTDVR